MFGFGVYLLYLWRHFIHFLNIPLFLEIVTQRATMDRRVEKHRLLVADNKTTRPYNTKTNGRKQR